MGTNKDNTDFVDSITSALERMASGIERGIQNCAAPDGIAAKAVESVKKAFKNISGKRNVFSEYKRKLESNGSGAVSKFIGELFALSAVGAGLVFLNMKFSPGFRWSLIAIGGLAIAVGENFVKMIRDKQKAREIQDMPELEAEALDVYKKINAKKDDTLESAAQLISVPALLFTVNVLVSPGFLWALIPTAFIAMNSVSKLIRYPDAVQKLKEKLCGLVGVQSWNEIFSKVIVKKNRAETGLPVYDMVSALRDGIAADIQAGNTVEGFGADMIPELDTYLVEVKRLETSLREIDAIIQSIPLSALNADKKVLITKRDVSDNPRLVREYDASIAAIERQETSFKELSDQRELMRLRLASSAAAMKQLTLDMARLKALPDDSYTMRIIQDRVKSLSSYLHDVRTGYDELGADPFDGLP